MLIWFALTAGVAAALSSLGQGAASGQVPSALDPILDCRDIAEDGARLACFDTAAEALSANADEIVTVNRREVEAVERESFGLQLPRLSLGFFGGRGSDESPSDDELALAEPATPDREAPDAAPEEVRVVERDSEGRIDRVEIAVDRVERVGYDTIQIYTRNGQVWEIIDRVGQRPIRARDDSYITISRASLGSYLMQLDGRGRLYRVRRLR